MSSFCLIQTGITKLPSRQIFDEIARITGLSPKWYVFTWRGLNGEDFRSVFDRANIFEFNYEKYLPNIKESAEVFAYKYPEIDYVRAMSMFQLWSLASDQLTSVDADVFLKARVDNEVFGSDMSLRSLFSPATFSIPAGGNFRSGVGDHICAGKKNEVIQYLSLHKNIRTLAASEKFLHPERLVRAHVSSKISNKPERPAVIVRYRGGIYNYDMKWKQIAGFSGSLKLDDSTVVAFRAQSRCAIIPANTPQFRKVLLSFRKLWYKSRAFFKRF